MKGPSASAGARTAFCAVVLCAAALVPALVSSGSGLAGAATAVGSENAHAVTTPTFPRIAPPVHAPVPAPGASERLRIWATYYGWYTNTPPGCATAYLTGCAHGTGTYRDPITLASDPKEFSPGTLFYYPTVEKYFVMGDFCTTCVTSWKASRLRQVDLWIGGRHGTEFAAIDCEDALTQYSARGPERTPFIIDPPRGLRVSHEPLFTVRTGRCFGGARTTPTYAEYQNGSSEQCLAGPGTGGAAGAPVEVAACSSGVAGEELGFEGDFLMAGDLCLAMTTPAPTPTTTSRLEWARCTGGPREQFEVGTGPIEWVQYQRCVVQTGSGAGTLQMARCTPATPPDQTWTVIPEP